MGWEPFHVMALPQGEDSYKMFENKINEIHRSFFSKIQSAMHSSVNGHATTCELDLSNSLLKAAIVARASSNVSGYVQ